MQAVARAAQLAVEYRAQFGGDVWLDLLCYRRHGHNELDDPSFTQPAMYEHIRRRTTIADAYADELAEEGVWSAEQRRAEAEAFDAELERQFAAVEQSGARAERLAQRQTRGEIGVRER